MLRQVQPHSALQGPQHGCSGAGGQPRPSSPTVIVGWNPLHGGVHRGPVPLGVDSARAQRQSSGRLTELMCPSVGVTLALCFLSPGFDAGKGASLTSNPERRGDRWPPGKTMKVTVPRTRAIPITFPRRILTPLLDAHRGCRGSFPHGAGKTTDLGASPSNSNKEENRCWFCWSLWNTKYFYHLFWIYNTHAGWLEKIWKIQKV